MNIKFSSRSYDCQLKWLKYGNNNVAICAEDPVSHEPIGVLTVNPGTLVPQDYVAIKDYSENEGVLESLMLNGVVDAPEYQIPSGFVSIPVCKILNRKTI